MESYKRLSAYLRPYWWIIIIATLFSLVTSGLTGAIAWFIKPLTDGTLNRDAGVLKAFLISYIIFILLKSLSAFAGSYLMRAVGAKVVRDVRDQLFNKLIYLPMSFFVNKPSGDVISRVINDANVLQGVLGYVAKDLLVEIPTFMVLLTVALIRGWDIALLACIALPFSFYAIGKFGKKMKVIGRKTQEQISGLTVRLTESISGIKMIKAFVRQKLHLDKFDDENKKYYRIALKGARTIEYSKLAQELIGGIGLILISFYGVNQIVNGNMSEGDLVSCFTALMLMYTPVRRLGSANNSLQQARAAAERIFYMLDQDTEEDGTKELPAIRDSIEFSNFSFIYPGTDKKVIDNINLKINKGELTAIVGKSGAGKTTLVDMIPRFYRATEGKLLIDSIDINDATHRSLRDTIGIVSQDVILFNESVRENIALGKLDASNEEITEAARAAYAHDFIKDMPEGYDSLIGERGVRLSGGQKQRISIARALLKNPPILILDEATSSLDSASEVIVQKALDNLMTNRTTFVIAHRLSTIKKADRILVIDEGKIIETGTHEELLNKGGSYKVLYHSQFDRDDPNI